MGSKNYHIEPLTIKEANTYIEKYHRHHKKVKSHRYSLGAFKGYRLVGVAVVGRPVSRNVDQYLVAEITRLCTKGESNVCSFLYAACARVAREMGFDRIQTYILASETGISVEAAGWSLEATIRGKSWNGSRGRNTRRGRKEPPQVDKVAKKRYVKVFR